MRIVRRRVRSAASGAPAPVVYGMRSRRPGRLERLACATGGWWAMNLAADGTPCHLMAAASCDLTRGRATLRAHPQKCPRDAQTSGGVAPKEWTFGAIGTISP